MVSIVVIYVKFSIRQCLNYLSSMHSLSASVKGSWLFLNRFPCSKALGGDKKQHVGQGGSLYGRLKRSLSTLLDSFCGMSYDNTP